MHGLYFCEGGRLFGSRRHLLIVDLCSAGQPRRVLGFRLLEFDWASSQERMMEELLSSDLLRDKRHLAFECQRGFPVDSFCR